MALYGGYLFPLLESFFYYEHDIPPQNNIFYRLIRNSK